MEMQRANMQIPKTVKIGRKKYHIGRVKMRGFTRGKVFPEMGIIEMGSADPYVFWHELTHAILYEMGDDWWRNEKFVIEFSKRLDQAVKTARF
jgi:hypothetical protein